MIQKLSHATIFVTDQDAAKDFYVNKLGFEVRTDSTMQGDESEDMPKGFRWLTVSPKGQPDLEIILMKIAKNSFCDEESVELLHKLQKKGVLGAGAFTTADCRKTYEELKAKGVKFKFPPTERFYGIETTFVDNSGNWFSLTQPK